MVSVSATMQEGPRLAKAGESTARAESSKAVGSAKKEESGTEEVGIGGIGGIAAAASAAASPAAAATAAMEEEEVGKVTDSHMGREDGNKSAASMIRRRGVGGYKEVRKVVRDGEKGKGGGGSANMRRSGGQVEGELVHRRVGGGEGGRWMDEFGGGCASGRGRSEAQWARDALRTCIRLHRREVAQRARQFCCNICAGARTRGDGDGDAWTGAVRRYATRPRCATCARVGGWRCGARAHAHAPIGRAIWLTLSARRAREASCAFAADRIGAAAPRRHVWL